MEGCRHSLEEKRAQNSGERAVVSTRKDLFMFESKDLSVKRKIGSGGSNAIV